MKVLKFGGTSVGSAQRMKDVANLIMGEKNIIVLSAMSGTTNSLVEISDYLYKKNPDGANEIINNLLHKYLGHIEELYSTEEYKQKARELVTAHFDHIRSFTNDLFTLFEEKVVLAQGELMSTGMMDLYLKERGVKATFFVLGQNIQGKEEILRRMLGEGHLIGNHTFSHRDLTALSEKEAEQEVIRAGNAIYEAAGVYTAFIRPPFGRWPQPAERSIL